VDAFAIVEDILPGVAQLSIQAGVRGKFTLWIGSWDYPTNRGAYWGCTAAMSKVLDMMRRRRTTS
jgi:hypothetical protein